MQLPHNIANKLNCLKSQFSQNKTLLLATIISLLCHVFLLAKFPLKLPELDESYQTLEMHLVNMQPVQKTITTPVKQSPPKLAPTPIITPEQPIKTNQKLEAQADTNPINEAPYTIEKPAIESLVEDVQQAEQLLEPTIMEPLSTETIESAEISVVNDSATESSHSTLPYIYVETVFDVRRGGDATAAGTARIIFNFDKTNDRYTLTSKTEAKGLASLFFDTLIQSSEGLVTASGFMPYLFTYQYGNNQSQKASFNWDEAILKLSSAKGEKTENLATGTQDILSVMYQFMFMQPRYDTQITITNGKNLRTYDYHFEGEKVITTKLGQLNTLHLIKGDGEQAKTELWLALDYQYLPVQIRKTEKDGSVIEQTATEIYALPISN
ncbi:MAG: DUF3108 domain-containing protein [Methylotenera sp.]|nr:DUF3108 domain-containing protein [Methylotenera sp.]